MAKDRRIYRTGVRWKAVLLVLLIVIALIVTVALSLFFGFKKYIVYTSDGVRLEVPWLTDEEITETYEKS
ncbi:MAG: hypothetical protein IJ788_02895 [Oscillospiraceae bacterium]|nr:hypothetical protein [Oscillospiraceae bacterium]